MFLELDLKIFKFALKSGQRRFLQGSSSRWPLIFDGTDTIHVERLPSAGRLGYCPSKQSIQLQVFPVLS